MTRRRWHYPPVEPDQLSEKSRISFYFMKQYDSRPVCMRTLPMGIAPCFCGVDGFQNSAMMASMTPLLSLINRKAISAMDLHQ
jgi:hypothetical protein